jgi:voltage-gated sodium channel
MKFRARLRAILEDRRFETAIAALIIVNAVTLGLETSPAIMAAAGPILIAIDHALLAVFVVELVARLFALGPSFFRSGWNWFDFIIIVVSLLPATAGASVLRALRILRVLRLITVIPSLKRVVGAMISALPGMGSIVLLLLLVFYVGSVMATKLFGATEQEAFGDLGRSLYTLFQLMTLDGWSGEIVKPVLANHPYAMLFFVPFILFSAFVVLNLFIGVVVGAMQSEAEAAARSGMDALAEQEKRMDDEILLELRALRAEVAQLRGEVGNRA